MILSVVYTLISMPAEITFSYATACILGARPVESAEQEEEEDEEPVEEEDTDNVVEGKELQF